MKNAEIQNIKKIMGLAHQKEYKDTTSLRYGSLMIMTDQVQSLLLRLAGGLISDADALKKFPMTLKKKEHSAYGAFFRDDIDTTAKPTKIKF